MKITDLYIKNFLSIQELSIPDIDNTLILVGKNNVGKSSIISAIRLLCGSYELKEYSRHTLNQPIVIRATLKLYETDIDNFYNNRLVSRHRKREKWMTEFKERIHLHDGDSTTMILKAYPGGEKDMATRFRKTIPTSRRFCRC